MRDLSKIFNPKSVAIIGASSQEKTVGFGLVKNILTGKDVRKAFFVNPNQIEILGNKTFNKITDIPEEIDLAVIAVPAKFVLEVINDCCNKKVGGIIIISAGFGEMGEDGVARQKEILEKVKNAGIPMIGPNCLGVVKTENKLNASFSPATPADGEISFVSQSGALLDVIIDGVAKLGLSSGISYGNEADVTLTDFLEWLANDNDTKVIALYVEAIKDGKKFMEVASKITKIKPIVAIKAGKFESGAKAVQSHTGSMAGDYEVYKSVFKQTGIIEADSIEELVDISKLLSWQPNCENSFAIVTNGGGCGVLAADYCKIQEINLAELFEETINKISSSKDMSPHWSKHNPLDIVGDASSAGYKVAIEEALSQKNVAGLMVIQTPQIMTDPMENAKTIIEAQKLFPKKPVICFFLGGKLSDEAIELLEKNHIPNYSDLKCGIIAIKSLIKK
ncbi:MAG: CoA-binding protein [Candidatus Staskawiczbacteria bacterium]|jgi:acetyltransferase